MSHFLRQLARQAAGQPLPGQPRPLRTPDAFRSTDSDAGAAFEGNPAVQLQDESEHEPGLPGVRARSRTLNERAPTPSSTLQDPDQTIELPSPARSTHEQATAASPSTIDRSPAHAPTAPPARFDSLEALLPAILDPRRRTSQSDPRSSPDSPAIEADSYDEIGQERPAGTARTTTSPARETSSRPGRATKSITPDHARLAAAPAAPDVHIHIGRVELTALQPPAPRPAPRREEKKPMSLEDYLRQRDGRRT